MKRSFASATRDISPPPNAKRQNTTKSAARNSFFTPLSQKEVSPTKIDWQIRHETLIMGKYRRQDIRPKPTRIAAFDLDGTLIRVKSGTRFATNAGDWDWLYTKIPGRLRELHAEGYEVVIFSNQSRISFDPKAKLYPQWKQKLQAIAETLDVPMMVFAATSKDDWFRKPRVGMWDAYAKEMGISLKDGLEMFYVGDAAGRMGAQSTRRIKDHGDTDRKFAMNLKIPFHTPEEYFLGDPPAEFIIGAFNPLSYIPTQTIPSPTDGSSAINSTENISANGSAVPLISPPEKPDIILFVGSPAAGKSTFFRENLAPLGYERINQDTLKTRDRCVAEATALLEKNIPMAIDNTNAEKSTRKFWVDLSRKFSRPIRCIYFTASAQLARHNNLVRALGGKAVEKRKVLPLAAIYSYLQRFQEPTLEEGFTEIVKVDFVFRGTKEEREVWSLWWD